tara:strand:+ start:3349 stop:4110 length:762 start_codon:yes stop_codon:yes gene_type:complete
MVALSVNLNKIALIRNSRDTEIPSVTDFAAKCISAGADGITVHPRPDQRHIRAQDCFDLKSMLKVEFNIEGNPFTDGRKSDRKGVADYPGFMDLIRDIKPTQCTLVPDSDSQLTSDHGFNLIKDADRVAPIVDELKSMGIRTSLFMDPDPEQIKIAAEINTHRIELYTESFARASIVKKDLDPVFKIYQTAADTANDYGLGLNAGHDLNLDNLPKFCEIKNLLEVSIGHHLTVDALDMGLEQAVRSYKKILNP